MKLFKSRSGEFIVRLCDNIRKDRWSQRNCLKLIDVLLTVIALVGSYSIPHIYKYLCVSDSVMEIEPRQTICMNNYCIMDLIYA